MKKRDAHTRKTLNMITLCPSHISNDTHHQHWFNPRAAIKLPPPPPPPLLPQGLLCHRAALTGLLRKTRFTFDSKHESVFSFPLPFSTRPLYCQTMLKKKKTPLLDVYSSGQLSIHWDKRTSEWRTARRTCIRNRRLQSKEFGLAFIHLTLSLSLFFFFEFLFLCVCVFHTNFGAIAIDLTPTLSLYSCTTVQPTRFRCQNCTTAKQINVSSSVRIVAPSFSPNCQSCNERRRAYRLCFSPNSMSVAISRRSFFVFV